MEAAVKLMIPQPAQPKPLIPPPSIPLNSSVQQFSGSTQYSPGTPAPKIPMIVPHTLQSGASFPYRPTLPKPFTPPPTPTYSQQNFRWNYTATPKNGIMTYAPGYGATEIRQPQTNLQFSVSQPARNLDTSLKFRSTGTGVHAYATAPAAEEQLQATQYVLPTKHLPPPANWAEWYRRVGDAVYSQWKQSTVGPGKVTLQLTVYNTHNVDAKVVDFNPAAGVEPNPISDGRFREASIKTFNNLDGRDIWTFPASAAGTKKIAFEMELDHAVGETPGCSIVRMHNQ